MCGQNSLHVPVLPCVEELYPRRRPTEFYRSLNPRASIQSLLAEHPKDVLNSGYIQQVAPQLLFPRIQPPRTSSTAFLRNNYFS